MIYEKEITDKKTPWQSTFKKSGISYERVSSVVISLSMISALLLGLFVHKAFFLIQVGMACNLIQSAITEKCMFKNILISLGFSGEKDLGRNEILISTSNNGMKN